MRTEGVAPGGYPWVWADGTLVQDKGGHFSLLTVPPLFEFYVFRSPGPVLDSMPVRSSHNIRFR